MPARNARIRGLVLISMLTTAIALSALPVSAWHGIYTKHRYYSPPSGYPWNGIKVFLSSPRHPDSRFRGECWNPGFEENVNGFQFGWHAATGGYYWEQSSNSGFRNFRESHYKVVVSKNKRDNGYLGNRATSENWNSKFHITIHTNADTGCPQSINHLLTMYRSGRPKSKRLADELLAHLDPVVPGGTRQISASHAELYTQAPWVAYLELAFHDKQWSQRWIHDNSRKSGWRLRWMVDNIKGYPR